MIATYVRGIERLLDRGHRVVLVYPIPEAGWNVPEELARRREASPVPVTLSTARAVYDAARPRSSPPSTPSPAPPLPRPPGRLLCDRDPPGRCINNIGDRPLYFDSNHLNGLGAGLIAKASPPRAEAAEESAHDRALDRPLHAGRQTAARSRASSPTHGVPSPPRVAPPPTASYSSRRNDPLVAPPTALSASRRDSPGRRTLRRLLMQRQEGRRHAGPEPPPALAETVAHALIDAEGYARMYAASIADPDAFWGEQAQRLDWIKPFTRVKNASFAYPDVSIKWFEDGVLNVAANCIDRHLASRGEQTAIIWECDDPASPSASPTASCTRRSAVRQRAARASASPRATGSASTCR